MALKEILLGLTQGGNAFLDSYLRASQLAQRGRDRQRRLDLEERRTNLSEERLKRQQAGDAAKAEEASKADYQQRLAIMAGMDPKQFGQTFGPVGTQPTMAAGQVADRFAAAKTYGPKIEGGMQAMGKKGAGRFQQEFGAAPISEQARALPSFAQAFQEGERKRKAAEHQSHLERQIAAAKRQTASTGAIRSEQNFQQRQRIAAAKKRGRELHEMRQRGDQGPIQGEVIEYEPGRTPMRDRGQEAQIALAKSAIQDLRKKLNNPETAVMIRATITPADFANIGRDFAMLGMEMQPQELAQILGLSPDKTAEMLSAIGAAQ